ncbi:MAG: hypothetical protein KDA77_17995, partial [Planctomycetaceae bacterium]|nr:hypothetical protein [Planctomycetaceae bacterium]
MSQPDTVKQTTKKKTSAKSQEKQRGSAGRIFFVLMIGLCVLLWFAPPIISNTSLKNSILPLVMKRYPGEITTGAVSLSWSQPVVFQNVALKDFEGRDVVRIDRIATQKTLWELAKDRKHVGDVNVDGVTTLTYVNEHGLANRDLLTAILNKGTKAHPEGEPGKEATTPQTGTQQSLTLHLSDLDLCVVNGDAEVTPYLTGMDITVSRPAQRTEPIIVKGNWKQPATEAGEQINPAQIAFTLSTVNSNGPDASRSGALQFKTEFFDLDQLTPLISALSPGAHLDGISNSEMEIKWSGSKESPRFAVKGNWEAAPFDFAAPALIGGDQIQTDSASGNIDVMAANGVLYFKDARLQSQFGQLALQGNLNWDDLTDESKREKLAGLLNSRLKLS